MAVINTNVKALFSQAALKSGERSTAIAMQQLSTGKRINSARDDAAGMAIATRMTYQIRSLNMAVRNAGDAISLIQTAEGATNEITDMMVRMRELAIQAVNDTNANEQRSDLDLEFQQLKQEIVRIADTTELDFRIPLRIPMIDVHTIGAGGGSIAYIDRGGMLHVGPRSAGAVPGPICFGRGGREPTVTDANAVLGRD